MMRMAKLDWLWMPVLVILAVVVLWSVSSATWATSLPSPLKTLEVSKLYLVEPFAKRGELDQGILRFTWYSLVLVAKGYSIAILLGTPLGFLLGMSKLFTKGFDPLIQILRPVSPLAWLPLGLVLFGKSEPAAIFTIAICSMWPTVLNTAWGVRAIPPGLHERRASAASLQVGHALQDHAACGSPLHVYRVSIELGIAWLVIVAAEIADGSSGVGGFLWQEYNSLIYEHIILCILTIASWALC
jgi:nitrate/nitrite transport system permease protein